MGNSIFDIGVSALNAAQAGLITTGHNISNANTPGYSRQQIVQQANLPQATGVGFLGQGVQVTTVKRIYSDYLATQLNTVQSQGSQLDSYYAQVSQIDNLLGDGSTGLSPSLSSFFNAVQGVATNPASMPSRQAMLSSANSLVSSFQSLDQQLTQIRNSVNGQIADSVSTINADATQIASLNQAIVQAQSTANGQPPNDLLDQRDELIAQLNKQVQASVVKQSNGSVNVFIGNGQALVMGNQATQLVATSSPTDPQRTEVGYPAGGTTVVLASSSLPGGTLGGLFSFRSQSLDPAQNALGRIAIGLAQTFNAQHELGQDLNGALGGAFFSVPSPTVLTASTNTGSGSVSATVADASALTTSDYQLTYNGTNTSGNADYTLTRLSDGTTTDINFAPASYPYSTTVDGVQLTIGSGAAVGDTWKIEPARYGASGIAVAITDPSKIAAASPVSTAASTTNTGDATISAGSAISVPSGASGTSVSFPTVTLAYSSTTGQFSVSASSNPPTTSGPTLSSTTYTSGTSYTLAINGYTFGFTISGQPANNDTFTIGPNTAGVSDNRNALALAALQSANTLGATTSGGQPTMSYTGAYAALAARIGDQTNSTQVQQTAQQNLIQQTQQAQQSVSGVNLDEEAANLLRYQQVYQAAGKMLQIASTLFQSILSI